MGKTKPKKTLWLILGFSLISILISLIDMGVAKIGFIPIIGGIIQNLGNDALEMLQMTLAAIRVLMIAGMIKMFK